MKNEFDYQEVPYDFAHCLNDQCTQVNHCLRHLAAANSTSIRKFFPIVNPAHYPKERDKCPFFKSQIKKRIALGITNLLDNVPHKTALRALRKNTLLPFLAQGKRVIARTSNFYQTTFWTERNQRRTGFRFIQGKLWLVKKFQQIFFEKLKFQTAPAFETLVSSDETFVSLRETKISTTDTFVFDVETNDQCQ